MTTRNELIYSIRSIIGDDEPSGFFTKVQNGKEIYKVPNYLFKDAPAEYPEIRISPFISEQTYLFTEWYGDFINWYNTEQPPQNGS